MTEPHDLTDLQLTLMGVLWARGEATVAEVQEALSAERPIAQTTVATLLSRLEKKGAVTHRTEGRQYVYTALLSEQEVRRTVVGGLMKRLFGDDVPALVSHLLGSRSVDADELARVRALVDARERELGGNDGR